MAGAAITPRCFNFQDFKVLQQLLANVKVRLYSPSSGLSPVVIKPLKSNKDTERVIKATFESETET